MARDEDLASPRGRIGLLAFERGCATLRLAVPCRHHPRREDTAINRVLLAGILYPTVQTGATEAVIEISDAVHGDGRTSVTLRPVNLLRLRELILGWDPSRGSRERRAYTAALALGEART